MPEKLKTEETWNITLNKYERDALISLLVACGGLSRGISAESIAPFTIANDGDWLGMVTYKLRPKKNEVFGRIKRWSESVKWWLDREKKTENDLMKDLVK